MTPTPTATPSTPAKRPNQKMARWCSTPTARSPTPRRGFAGTDTFTYVASDESADSVPATVTITVINTPPVATKDSYIVQENAASFSVLCPRCSGQRL